MLQGVPVMRGSQATHGEQEYGCYTELSRWSLLLRVSRNVVIFLLV